MKIIIVALIMGAAACASGGSLQSVDDSYRDYAALRAAYTEGLEYSREIYDRGADIAVFAVHGGDIERFTSSLARKTAGKNFNLYIFNGWLGPDSGRLHLTSTRFDDPDAVRIASSSVLGVSFHEQAGHGVWVCVGGANKRAASLVSARLESAGFVTENPCRRLPGTSPENIVNRASSGGVQLELTSRLLSRLEKDGEYLSKFTEAVRSAAIEFVSSNR